MKKFLLAIGIILISSFSTFALHISTAHAKTFYPNETIYVSSNVNISLGLVEVNIYIVKDNNNWEDGTILIDVSGYVENVTTNSSGYLEPTKVWNPPLTIGKYDIVIDVDRDGIYNSTIDYVDNLYETGFEVVEIPMPTLTLSVGPNSPSDHNWNLDKNYLDNNNVMLQLKLTTNNIEDIKITSINLIAIGSGNDKSGIKFVSLILDDGNGTYDRDEEIISFGQYSKDDGILNLEIQNGYVIPINETIYMLLVYSMSNSSSNGDTYSFKVVSVSAIGITNSKVKVEGLPINSATKTIVAATAATTSTTTTTTITGTTTTSTITTTITQLPHSESKFIFILLMGLIPVAIVAIIAILFLKKKRASDEFEELKEKWKII